MLAKLLAVLAALFTALPAHASTGITDTVDDAEKQLRVLVLAGGGYHDFARNTDALVRGLEQIAGVTFSFHPHMLRGEMPENWHNRLAAQLSDPDVFKRYDAILTYHQGEFPEFTDEVKERFLDYIRSGGGLVAIHSSADSFPGWDDYDTMLGGRFESHPPFGEITVNSDIAEHQITRNLPTEWTLQDEFYHMKGVDERGMLVLMRGRSPGDDDDAPPRPVSWEKSYGHGRVFYTILGHGIEAHTDERFHQLIHNAIAWAADAPQPSDDGTYPLFDGSTLDGWSMTGPGKFIIENPGDDGVLLAIGGMGMLWYHERRFSDFELTVEWKTEKREDNSGVFVRFHEPPTSPWDAVHKGHEVQILDAEEGIRMTGAIYNHAPATKRASNPPGEWNTFVITVKGDTYTVVLNGETVCQWTSPAERHGLEGYIGLQNHSSPVRFRNIAVRPLRAAN